MDTRISTVQLVSDGLLVEFTEGTSCYFPTSFLLEHAGLGSNQIFLDFDSIVSELPPQSEMRGIDRIGSQASVPPLA